MMSSLLNQAVGCDEFPRRSEPAEKQEVNNICMKPERRRERRFDLSPHLSLFCMPEIP